MNTDQRNVSNNEQLQDDIQETVQTGRDVKETVRCITIKALTNGELDMKSVRQVADAVIKGASLGAENHNLEARQLLTEAVSGLDEALSKAAEASKLALQESVGKTEEFSSHDLKRTLNDLQGLEEIFVETLRDAAKGGEDQVSIILHDLAEHSQHSGTAVGSQLKDGLSKLVHQVGDAGKIRLESGTDSIKTTGALLARIAAGMLEGIADSIQPSPDDESNSPSQDKAD